jgi:transcriptional regulator with XRE-family HTH domain
MEGRTQPTATAPAEPADYLTGAPDACMNEVGALIRAARKAAREEQASVAARIGVTQAGVSRWESGERDPGVTGLIRIAEALGVPASSLLPAAHRPAAEAGPHAEIARLRGELSKVRAIAFRPGMSHMLKLRALHELLDPTLKPAADREELRVALANLTDRAEASQAITEDEAGEYRKLTEKAGD